MKYYLFHERASLCRYRKALLVMKLSIILLVAFVLNAGAKGTAQTVSLSVTNMPLEKVCKEIEKQTGFYFVYAKEMNKENLLVSLTVKSASVEETLKQLFEGLPFKYELIDKVVVVNTVNKIADLLKPVETIGDEGITIEGVVLSDQGQPLAGASVMVKKTGRITFTDAKGKFSLKNVAENTVLVITNVGFAPKQVSVHGGSIRIQLEIATNDLDAMVIKGYYNTSNRLNTGNAVTVKGEDIRKQPVTDPIQALEGRVAGLNIQQYSGVPGAYATVQIRGRNSIASGLDPFYIVDGVPYSNQSLTNPYLGGGAVGVPINNRPGSAPQNNGTGLSPFNNLNPNDIESVTVLKDADATAIYGSRGANGVILITTRKGKAGQTKVDVNLYSGAGKITRKIDLLNTREYLAMRREAFRNDGVQPDPTYDYDLTYWDTTRYTDWQKILLGNASRFTNAQVNISGGNAVTQFLVGLGYSNQGTVYAGNYKDQKASVHLNLNNSSNNQRFHIGVSADYTYDANKLPLVDFVGNIIRAPNSPAIFNSDGSINWAIKDGEVTFIGNPLANTFNRAKANTDNLVGSVGVDYLILPGLKLSGNFGYTQSRSQQQNLTFSSSIRPPNNTNPASRSNSFSTQSTSSWIIEPQLNYNLKAWKGIFETSIGSSFQSTSSSSIGQNASGFVNDALVQNPIAATSLQLINYDASQYRYSAVYGRFGYNLLERYLINITGRRDGSSRFGPGRQFGNFGAIGAGWIFSNEAFFKKINIISYGKIRGSYGITGNDQLPNYKYLDTYTPYTGGTYQGISGLIPTQITNPYFAWERDRKLEVGLELGFWNNRATFSSSFYCNRTDNQLVGYALPLITGASSVQANLPALIQNTGWEYTFTATVLRTRDFTWNTSCNLSIPRNKLVSYPNIENSPYQYAFKVGKPLSVLYLYHFLGVNPQTGLYTFSSKSGSNMPDFFSDKYFSRPVTQQYYGGLQNSFTYKGLQIDIFVQFVKQLGKNYLSNYNLVEPGVMDYNFPRSVLKRWTAPGDITNTQLFSQSYGDPYNIYTGYLNLSDAIISDASFIRIKSLSVAYNLPEKVVKKAKMQTMRIYCQTQNLFTITRYLGMDPETQGTLPPIRMITCGLQLVL